jgi:hypothetical protein
MERTATQKRYTDKETITHAEYCTLLGLSLLAAQHNAALKSIIKAGETILEMKPEGIGGHISDVLYCDDPIDEALSKLGVTVEPQPVIVQSS